MTDDNERGRVLAVHAHPDDIEFVMAGTMALLGQAGFELHYLCIANGSCGSLELDAARTIALRRTEAAQAASVLGARYHESLCDDLAILYTEPLLRQVTAVVRRVRPTIVLTASPDDYMEDHMNACRLAVTAAFARGFPNYSSDPAAAPYDGDVVVYHAQPHGHVDGLRRPVVPEFVVDVTDVVDLKRRALACHASQKEWLDRTQGFDSYLDAMAELSAQAGAFVPGVAGRTAVQYGEGWRRHLHLGFSRTESRPLEEALGTLVHPVPPRGT